MLFRSERFITEQLNVPYTFAPPHLNKQRAGTVAALARSYFTEGKMTDAATYKPEYLRLSQAERERMEREHAAD